MRTGCVTYTDVEIVCEKLQSTDDQKITTRKIRDEIGYGSLSTISKYFKEWRDARDCTEEQDCTKVLKTPQRLAAVQDLYPAKKQEPHIQPPKKTKCTGCTAMYTLVLAAAIVALTRYLVLESAATYSAASQTRPFEMAVITEACLLICAFARPSSWRYWIITKIAMIAILIFMGGLMYVRVDSSKTSNSVEKQRIESHIASIENYNLSIMDSIKDLEARSRITAASLQRDRLEQNHLELAKLRKQLNTTSLSSQIQDLVMTAFRIGAILLNVLFAHLLASLWTSRRRMTSE